MAEFRNRIVEHGTRRADQFLPHPRNPKTHPAFQRDVIKALLGSIGWVSEVIESLHSGYLLDGHERVWTALDVGDDEPIPFIVVDVTEEEELKILATLDPSGYLAQHHAETLNGLMKDIGKQSGFIGEMLAALQEKANSIERVPPGAADAQMDRAAELQTVWNVRRGDLWTIGRHRLLCGDSTNADDVARVMGDETAQLVITDPPYGVEYGDKNAFLNAIGRGNRIQTPTEGDHSTKEETQAMWKAAFKEMATIMSPGAVVYCFMPQGGDQMMMMMMMMGAGIEPRHELIWLKNNHVLGRTDYAYKHEPILYAWKEGGHKFYGDFQTSVIECDKPMKSDLHPTTKPVELVERLMTNSSQRSEVVFDPFLGSGTTLVACEQLGRQGRGIEISENYCAVILQRLSDMGLSPEREA